MVKLQEVMEKVCGCWSALLTRSVVDENFLFSMCIFTSSINSSQNAAYHPHCPTASPLRACQVTKAGDGYPDSLVLGKGFSAKPGLDGRSREGRLLRNLGLQPDNMMQGGLPVFA